MKEERLVHIEKGKRKCGGDGRKRDGENVQA